MQHHPSDEAIERYLPPIPAETAGLRAIALFETFKGLVVLAAGYGMLAFLHQDLRRAVIHVIHRLRLDPSTRLPTMAMHWAGNAGDRELWLLAAVATLYAVIRFAEAVGLWLDRNWGNWIGALSGGIYLPIEAYEVVVRFNALRLGIFVSNLLIVLFLCHRLHVKHKARAIAEARLLNESGCGETATERSPP